MSQDVSATAAKRHHAALHGLSCQRWVASPAKPLLPLSSCGFQVVSGGLHPLPLMSLGSPTFWLGDAG